MKLADCPSGRQDAPFNGRTLYFNILISSENRNSANHSLAPIDLKKRYKGSQLASRFYLVQK